MTDNKNKVDNTKELKPNPELANALVVFHALIPVKNSENIKVLTDAFVAGWNTRARPEPTEEEIKTIAEALHRETVNSYNSTAKPHDKDWQNDLYTRLAKAALNAYINGR